MVCSVLWLVGLGNGSGGCAGGRCLLTVDSPGSDRGGGDDREQYEAGGAEEGGVDPRVSAWLIGCPVAARCSVLVVAIDESTASPRAPPICWVVLTKPLASPYSRSLTPLTDR